jgi:dipeptidase D
MDSPLAALEPRILWNHFDALRRIPRPSGHEARVREHLRRWAAERKFEVREDAIGNLCVRVPATPGHERARTVILQGHLDMVAEKDKATTFDFLQDAIEVRIDGDWVVAEHTTLGADNGIGVAAAMASADEPGVVHGPLELLFTVDEETALTGASNLDGALLEGRTLINLDSEEDGTLFVGCAGGCTTEITFELEQDAAPQGFVPIRLEVTGLKGGHSGLMIHENRGNSLKVLARVLSRCMERAPVLLAALEGGNKHNAIPREAGATVFVPAAFVAEARELALDVRNRSLTEIGSIDPGLAVSVQELAEAPSKAAYAESTKRLVLLLLALPHGVIAMSRDIPGLTETSTNVAVARTEGDRVILTTSSRSSVAAALRFVLDQIKSAVELAQATSRELSSYPGWQPDMASALLRVCQEAHRALRGAEPKVTAIHAGLECGIIGEKLAGGVDMISYGPHLEGVHAPGERVHIPSVGRFWEFHKEVLRRLA